MSRPEYVARDADGVEALPGSLASLLHCLHWRHEHNVQPGRVLDISISWGVYWELLKQNRLLVNFVSNLISFNLPTCDLSAALAILIR